MGPSSRLILVNFVNNFGEISSKQSFLPKFWLFGTLFVQLVYPFSTFRHEHWRNFFWIAIFAQFVKSLRLFQPAHVYSLKTLSATLAKFRQICQLCPNFHWFTNFATWSKLSTHLPKLAWGFFCVCLWHKKIFSAYLKSLLKYRMPFFFLKYLFSF